MDTLVSIGVIAATGLEPVRAARHPGRRPRHDDADVAGRQQRGDSAPPLPRGRQHHGGAHPRRPLVRGRVEAPRRRRAAGAARRWRRRHRPWSTTDGTETDRPAAELRVGDRFVVRPGERIATDGVVEEGASAVDMSLVTGESVPREWSPATPSPAPPSTPTAGSWCAPPESAPTRHSPRWPAWWRPRRAARRRCSGWPTASPACSCPVVMVLAAATLGFWFARTGSLTEAMARRWPCSSSPARAHSAWPPPPRCWWAPAAARRWASSSRGPRCWRAPASRHDRARQDRHGHHRPMHVADVSRLECAATSTDVLRAGRRRRAGQRAPHRQRHRPRRATRPRLGPRRPTSSPDAGWAHGHGRRVDACRVGRADADGLQAMAHGDGRTVVAVERRRHRRRHHRRRRHREAHQRGRHRRAAAPGPAADAAHRRQRGHRAAVAAQVGIAADDVHAGVLPARRWPRCTRCRPRAGGGDGGRRRERRRRARPGRPRHRHGHGHRRGHRGQRPHAGACRPARRRRRDPAQPAHAGDHQGQPVLGVRLQRRRHPAGRRRMLSPVVASAAMASPACSW